MKKCFLILCFVSTLCFASDLGFEITDIQQNSFYSKVQLKKGDVLKKINDKSISGMNEVMEFMGNPNSVKSILVIRDGKEKTINL